MAIKLMSLEHIIDTNMIRYFFTGGVRTDYKAQFPEIKSGKLNSVE